MQAIDNYGGNFEILILSVAISDSIREETGSQ